MRVEFTAPSSTPHSSVRVTPIPRALLLALTVTRFIHASPPTLPTGDDSRGFIRCPATPSLASESSTVRPAPTASFFPRARRSTLTTACRPTASSQRLFSLTARTRGTHSRRRSGPFCTHAATPPTVAGSAWPLAPPPPVPARAVGEARRTAVSDAGAIDTHGSGGDATAA